VHFLIGTQSLSEGVSCAALLNASRKPFVGEVALLPIQLEELTDRDLLFFLFLDRERPLASTIMPSDWVHGFQKAAGIKVKQSIGAQRNRLIVECLSACC
jgi:hypothetical protein